MYRLLPLAVITCLTLTACGSESGPDATEVAMTVDAAIRVTLTAMRPTASPRPTSTPRPTATQSAMPGIGHLVECDSMFALRVLEPPHVGSPDGYYQDENLSQAGRAKGVYVKVVFELTNLQAKTSDLGGKAGISLTASLDGRRVSFEPVGSGLSIAEQEEGLSDWWDDLPPGLSIIARALFDVNPAATDWTLLLTPQRSLETICSVEVALADRLGVSKQ